MDTNTVQAISIPKITLLAGGAILIAGLWAMIADSESIAPGLTLAAIGTVLEASGLGALIYPSARKHFIHVAILAAMFGMVNMLSSLPANGEDWNLTELITAGSSILCAVLFVVYLKSFINARRVKTSSSNEPGN